MGVVKCLKGRGIDVPETVAVIGYNNSVLAACCEPVLTSVDSRMYEMGRTAIEIFSKVMEGVAADRKTCLQPRLCKGKSG